MNNPACDTVMSALPGIGMGVLFVLSELLPFISKVKANGLLEGTIIYLKSKRPPSQPEQDLERGLPEQDDDTQHTENENQQLLN